MGAGRIGAMGRRLSQQPEVGAQVVSTLVTTVTNGLESFANDPEKFGGEIAIDALARAGIKTPDDCHDFFSGGLECEQSNPRTVWTNASQIPDDGGTESGILFWGCGYFAHSSQCSFTFSFRGIGSSDSDGDLASWSVDFWRRHVDER